MYEQEQAKYYAAQQAGQALQGNQAQGVEVPKTVFGAAEFEMDIIRKHASENLSRLVAISSQLFGGGVPSPGTDKPPRPVPTGAVHSLAEKIDAIKSVLRDQSQVIEQLNRLV